MDLQSSKAQSALLIAQKLHAAGFLAYFAGGCVRDTLLGARPQDFDIATSCPPEKVESLFTKTIAVGKQFGVILVVESGDSVEVTTFRKEGGYHDGRHPTDISFTDAREDATRRDFTVNGLFYDPFEKKILDFVEGREDIRRRVIRAIGDPAQRFEEDKLRLLRAVRFAANLGFEIEKKTWESIKKMAPAIHSVSPERIRDELVKIFTRAGAVRGFDLLSDSGLMKEILPEIEAMRGVEQQPEWHPEGDVFIHTRLLLEKMSEPDRVLVFSALLHDVAKPVTFQRREDGKITFYEHAHIGAEMARAILKRLRFSNQEIDDVAVCVENHMKFGDVKKMRSGKLKQFMVHPQFEAGLRLHRIDCLSSHGLLDNYHFLLEKKEALKEEELKPKAWLSGNDLIALGMVPGPAMKPLLEEAYLLQLENRFESKEQALHWVKDRLAHPSSGDPEPA